jgi:transcriptional regulator with XRE-family HTH domain
MTCKRKTSIVILLSRNEGNHKRTAGCLKQSYQGRMRAKVVKPKEHSASKKNARPDRAKAIGRQLRERRDLLDLSNQDLATRLNVEEQTVRNMLSGQGLVTYVKLAKLARALETSPNQILGFDEGDSCDAAMVRSALLGAFEGCGLGADATKELADIFLESLRDSQKDASPADRGKILRGHLRLVAKRLSQPKS